jgi:hypothetical protein
MAKASEGAENDGGHEAGWLAENRSGFGQGHEGVLARTEGGRRFRARRQWRNAEGRTGKTSSRELAQIEMI